MTPISTTAHHSAPTPIDDDFSEESLLDSILSPPSPVPLVLLLPLARASLPTLPPAQRVIKSTLSLGIYAVCISMCVCSIPFVLPSRDFLSLNPLSYTLILHLPRPLPPVEMVALAILSECWLGLEPASFDDTADGSDRPNANPNLNPNPYPSGVRYNLPVMWGLVQCTPENLESLDGEGLRAGLGGRARVSGGFGVFGRLPRSELSTLMDGIYSTLSACERLRPYLPLPPIGVLLDRPFAPALTPSPTLGPSPRAAFRAAEQARRSEYALCYLRGLGGLSQRISGGLRSDATSDTTADVTADTSEAASVLAVSGEVGAGEEQVPPTINLGQALVVAACSRLGRALSTPAPGPTPTLTLDDPPSSFPNPTTSTPATTPTPNITPERLEIDQCTLSIAKSSYPWGRLADDLSGTLRSPLMAGVTGEFLGGALLRAMVYYCR